MEWGLNFGVQQLCSFFPVGASHGFFCHCTMAGLWSVHLGLLPEGSNPLICYKSGIWDFCLKVVVPYFVIMGWGFFPPKFGFSIN